MDVQSLLRGISGCNNEFLFRVTLFKSQGFKIVAAVVDIECQNLVLNNVPLDYVDQILNFLSDRRLCFGRSSIRLFNGFPQGSSLSPILFNLYSVSFHGIENDNTLVFRLYCPLTAPLRMLLIICLDSYWNLGVYVIPSIYHLIFGRLKLPTLKL